MQYFLSIKDMSYSEEYKAFKV